VDFCRGLPPKFRPRDGNPERLSKAIDRIHKGYGELAVSELLPLHLDEWLLAHPEWDGGRRSHI
jgi:hypothetical protein